VNYAHAAGFPPVYDENSVVLILGSFPSVKSRETAFYYGHKQNRFWRTVCEFFGEDVPATVAGKREFLLRRNIALWDVIIECDIIGSSDASIRNEVVADIPSVLEGGKIRAVLCNGSKSFSLFSERFPQYLPVAKKLSSTSPANPRFSSEEWREALLNLFPRA
jgi:hypoxanthine-DNA glycosylase